MRKLSRQNISRQIIGRNFFDPEYLPFEKLNLVRFKQRTFAAPLVFAATMLSVKETLQNLNSLWSKIHKESNESCGQSCLRKKKSSTRLLYPCLSQG